MDSSLEMTAQGGDIKALYQLINHNPYILESFDEIPFVTTPLHLATAAGHSQFAIEIMRLKPSFRRKLDPQGLSPLHLAIQNGHIETARRLVQVDSELIRVQGREGITPLHLVVEMEDEEDNIRGLLAEFLLACPLAIEDVTIRAENALHIAVQNHRIHMVTMLVGWLKWMKKEEILGWKDENGDTVLHIAASTNQPQALKMVISNENKVSMNSARLTALDIVMNLPNTVNAEAKRVLQLRRAYSAKSLRISKTDVDFISSSPRIWDWLVIQKIRIRMSLSMQAKSALLVVAALIMTITYQGILSPPGGLLSTEGVSVMDTLQFWMFGFFNTASFLLSAEVIIIISDILLPDNYFFPVHFLISSYCLAILFICPAPSYDDPFLIYLFIFLIIVQFVSPVWDAYEYYFPQSRYLRRKIIVHKMFKNSDMSHGNHGGRLT